VKIDKVRIARLWCGLAVILSGAVLISGVAFAQAVSQISGIIRDASGVPPPIMISTTILIESPSESRRASAGIGRWLRLAGRFTAMTSSGENPLCRFHQRHGIGQSYNAADDTPNCRATRLMTIG
jgi:hypothetical protein